jgi:F-type H+-transporting ATPase subunit a
MDTLNFFNVYTEKSEILSPLDQFEVRDLLSIDFPIIGNLHFSLTNIGLYLTVGLIFILILSLLSTNYNRLVSNK